MQEHKDQKVELTEKQLAQMAQQEEQTFHNKRALAERLGMMLNELANAEETIKEIKKSKEQMLISIGATILVEVKPINKEKCKRAIGENCYKEETLEETSQWLEQKEANLKKQFEIVEKEARESQSRLDQFVGILKQIQSEKRKAGAQAPPTLSK